MESLTDIIYPYRSEGIEIICTQERIISVKAILLHYVGTSWSLADEREVEIDHHKLFLSFPSLRVGKYILKILYTIASNMAGFDGYCAEEMYNLCVVHPYDIAAKYVPFSDKDLEDICDETSKPFCKDCGKIVDTDEKCDFCDEPVCIDCLADVGELCDADDLDLCNKCRDKSWYACPLCDGGYIYHGLETCIDGEETIVCNHCWEAWRGCGAWLDDELEERASKWARKCPKIGHGETEFGYCSKCNKVYYTDGIVKIGVKAKEPKLVTMDKWIK